jgi:hypothetical protein
MKSEKLTQQLTDLARNFGYKVRIEEGNFRGGSCVYRTERLIILNRRMTAEERAEALARALADESLEAVFIVPEVRAYLERFTASPTS